MKKIDYSILSKMLLIFLLTWGISTTCLGQLDCNALTQSVPDPLNQVGFTLEDLTDGPIDNSVDYIIWILDENGNRIASGLNEVTIRNASRYAGQILKDSIYTSAGNTICTGLINIGPFEPFECKEELLVFSPDGNNSFKITPQMVLKAPVDLSKEYDFSISNSGGDIASGTNEVVLNDADQYYGQLAVRVSELVSSEECTLNFLLLNHNSSTLTCTPFFEIAPITECDVAFNPDELLENPPPIGDYIGAIFDQNGLQVNEFGWNNFIFADLSDYEDFELTATVVQTSTGETCSSRLIITDTIAPSAFCNPALTYVITPGLTRRVRAFDVDNQSFDNCGFLDKKIYLVDEMGNPISTPENEIWFDSETKVHNLKMVVEDRKGNQDECSTTINIFESSQTITCIQDVNIAIDENCSAQLDIVELLEGTPPTNSVMIEITNPDSSFIQTGYDALSISNADALLDGVLIFELTDTLSKSSCKGFVQINDFIPPEALCKNLNFTEPGMPLTIYVSDIDDGSSDNCSLEKLEIATIDWVTGNASPFSDSIIIDINKDSIVQIGLSIFDKAGNPASCLSQVSIMGLSQTSITATGNVFDDLDANCTFDNGELGAAGWPIVVVSFPSFESTKTEASADGSYQIEHEFSTSDTLLKVFLLTRMNLTQECPNTFCFDPRIVGSEVSADFAIQRNPDEISDCPKLVVDISTSHLTRCDNSIYTVNYCNYGSAVAENATVQITLDPSLSLISSEIPVLSGANNQYTFDLGNVAIGVCDVFTFGVEVSCDAILGEAHPVQAIISPSEPCFLPTPGYSGASIEVTGECKGDSIEFIIKNVGDQDMIEALNYIVIEDIILHRSDNITLDQGIEEKFTVHGKGKTCRLESEQVIGHPGSSLPSITIEGCGLKDDGTISLGYYAQLPQDDGDIYRSIHVRENEDLINNLDLVAIPKGVGSQHFIKPNGDLEYLIRFKNSGNQAVQYAEAVVNLPTDLDITTLLPGASSHPYRFELDEEGRIRFIFENLNLLPERWVFVKYRVSQNPNLPEGTIIFNSAIVQLANDIPETTNETFHEISNDFLKVSITKNLMENVEVTIAPNPFVEQTKIALQGIENQQFRLRIFDLNGKQIREEFHSSNEIIFERKNLPKGLYFFKIYSEGNIPISTGKIFPTN